MPFADKKTWEKARPLSCHGSGVGKACDAWKTSCKSPQLIAGNERKVADAHKAIKLMNAALTKAEGKAKKEINKKAKTKVLTLIEDWRAEVLKYEGQLAGHIVLAGEEQEAQEKREFLESFAELAVGVQDTLKSMVKPLLAEIGTAIKNEEFGVAERKIQTAELSIQEGQRMAMEPEIPFRNILKKFKNLPNGAVSLRDVDSMLAPIRKTYPKQRKQLDEFKEQVEKFAGDAPKQYEFRAKYLDAQKLGKDAIAKIKDSTKGMKALSGRMKTLSGNEKALTEGDPAKVLQVAELMIQSMRKFEETAAGASVGDSIDISNLKENRRFTDEKAKQALGKLVDDIHKTYSKFSEITRECRGYMITILETVPASKSETTKLLKFVKFS